MESQPQNPEFRYNPENVTHVLLKEEPVSSCKLKSVEFVRLSDNESFSAKHGHQVYYSSD